MTSNSLRKMLLNADVPASSNVQILSDVHELLSLSKVQCMLSWYCMSLLHLLVC